MNYEISDEHKALAFMLQCRGWEGLFKPRVAEKVQEFYQQILDPSRSRKEKLNDDYLRGAIAALKWAVTWPDQELNAAVIVAQEQSRETAAEDNQPLFGSPPPNGHGGLNGNSRF